MRLFGREAHGIPAALVVLVAVLLLSSGLCGVTGSIEQSHGWGWMDPRPPNTLLGNALGFFSSVGFFGVAGSGLGIALLLLVWPVIAINNWMSGGSGGSDEDGLQRLFESKSGQDDADVP